MRLPKLRGFTNPAKVEAQVVNLDRLSELFPAGGTVTVDDLVAAVQAMSRGRAMRRLEQADLPVVMERAHGNARARRQLADFPERVIHLRKG
jgi:large subunit ribosomal protein L15